MTEPFDHQTPAGTGPGSRPVNEPAAPAGTGPASSPAGQPGQRDPDRTEPRPATGSGRDPAEGTAPVGDGGSPDQAGGVSTTGEPRVDAALAGLRGLVGRPVVDQVAGYEELHRALQDILATVDDA